MKPRHRRIALITAGVAGLALAAGLVLRALNENLEIGRAHV